MQPYLNLAIILGLALSGLPHAFCGCGSGAAVEQDTTPSCPDCGTGYSEPTPRQPKPCECQVCQIVKGISPGPVAEAPPLDPSSRVFPTPIERGVQGVLGHLPEKLGGLGPPLALPAPSCGLPILLGHLLF